MRDPLFNTTMAVAGNQQCFNNALAVLVRALCPSVSVTMDVAAMGLSTAITGRARLFGGVLMRFIG